MNNFWPKRPSPEGFSIKKLASTCRQKLSKKSFDGFDKYLKEKKLISKNTIPLIDRVKGHTKVSLPPSIHWANRDFFEYQDAA